MPTFSKNKLVAGSGVALAAGAALLVQQLAAPAPCPSTDVCLSWAASTKYEDGTSIAASKVVTYKAYRENPRTLIASTQSLATRVGGQPRGVQSYVVTATVDGAESKDGARVSKTIRFAGPSNGSIEAPSDGGIESK